MATDSAPRRSGGLDRKVGPLPLKIWLLIAAALVVGFIFLRHPAASGAATNASDSSSQLPGNTSDTTGANGSPSDAATADLLAALGSDNQMLLQSLLSQSSLFYNGGAQFVPGSATSSADAGGGGVTQQIAELTGLAPPGQISSPSYAATVSGGQSAPQYVSPSNPGGYFIGGPAQVAPPQTFGQAPPTQSTNTGTRNIAV